MIEMGNDNEGCKVVRCVLSFVFLAVISKEAFSHRGVFLVFFQIFIHLKYIAYIGFLFNT